MKRKRNPIKCKIGILFATVLLLVSGLTLKAEAGFGDFNDYDSGGWDSGSDWGSDWDSDYDWDDGWSSTGTYSYSSSSGSIDGVEQIMYMFLLITVVVIRVVLRAYKSSNRTTSTGTRRTTSMPVRTQTKILPDRTNEISKIIQENDPCFTAPDFISFAKSMEAIGVKSIVFTDIDTDGTLQGPAFKRLEQLRDAAREAIEDCLDEGYADWTEIKNNVKDRMSKFIFNQTKRRPMILPIIMNV